MRANTSLSRAVLGFAASALPLFAGVSGDPSLVELVKADNQQAAIALIDQHVDVNTPPPTAPRRCFGPRTTATWS